MLGELKTALALARDLAREEKGGAAVEMAVLAGLVALFALTMREMVAMPLLSTFSRAARVVSQALAG